MQRHERPNPMNSEFARIVQELAGEATPQERAIWQKGAVELAFKGEIGKRIAQWHSEGLGKLVGMPTSIGTGNRLEQVVDKTAAFNGIMYVLPVTGEEIPPDEQRVVLVVPSSTGYDVAIAMPMKSELGSEELRNKRNAEMTKNFVRNFAPSEKPFMYTSLWNPNDEQVTLPALVRSQEKFSMRILSAPDAAPAKLTLLKEAEKRARVLKEKRDRQQQITTWEGGQAA